jgi:hypothetical protein
LGSALYASSLRSLSLLNASGLINADALRPCQFCSTSLLNTSSFFHADALSASKFRCASLLDPCSLSSNASLNARRLVGSCAFRSHAGGAISLEQALCVGVGGRQAAGLDVSLLL